MSDCCTAFERFAGLRVEAQQSFYTIRWRGQNEQRSRFRIFKLDPVLLDMQKTAAANGLKLCVVGPDDKGRPDIDLKRVTISLMKAEGKWAVSPEFKIG